MVMGAAAQQPQQPQPTAPIIVKVIEPEKDITGGLADVLIGALGLSGVLFLMAVVAAMIFGSILFWLRRRKPYDHWS